MSGLIDKIQRARVDFIGLHFHREPDFIMMHPKKENALFEEVYYRNYRLGAIQSDLTNKTSFRGIPIIWTDQIGENEIICTGK